MTSTTSSYLSLLSPDVNEEEKIPKPLDLHWILNFNMRESKDRYCNTDRFGHSKSYQGLGLCSPSFHRRFSRHSNVKAKKKTVEHWKHPDQLQIILSFMFKTKTSKKHTHCTAINVISVSYRPKINTSFSSLLKKNHFIHDTADNKLWHTL